MPKAELRASAYDAIIIGTGQAGPSLARRLAAAGMTVAVCERALFGGTCVNTGCIPTKTLIGSAYAIHMARRAADFGVVVDGPVRADMARVKARKDAISGQSRIGVEGSLKALENCTIYRGHARFVSPHEVQVGETLLSAERIFINVGGRAVVPAWPGLDQVAYLTNSSMMAVDFLPRHLVVIGGSYVGLEFAQMYRRFGSEVTVVEMAPRLIHREDPDVSATIQQILENEGVGIRLNATCIRAAKSGDEIVVGVDCTAGASEIHGSHLLVAVGRRPNTDDLGLDRAGIRQDDHGYIVVDDQLRTNVSGVWALGDCNGRGAFTHTAYNDFEIAAANLLDNDPRRLSDRIAAYALYTDPPLGRAGLTEDQVRGSGKPALIGTRPMTRVSRAVEKGEIHGFMKVLVDADSKEILGAAILGTGGDEVIHGILDVMYAKAPYTVLQRSVPIHPTVSELLPTLLGDLRPL
ncbi:MAG: FAD-containing oxidoreductase [Alphaproteobacteria bacterium]|nr:FAD-containing oxidoreductase [Alphaproteobacteria bacterium]